MSGWLDRRRLPIGGRRPGGNKGGGNTNPGSGPRGGGGGGGRGRGRGGGGNGGGGDVYLAPTFNTDTIANLIDGSDHVVVTTDGTNTLDKRNKIQVIMRNIAFTGTLTSIEVQVREQSGGAWRTAGTAYEYFWLSNGTAQDVTAGDGFPVTQLTAPTDIVFQIRGLGLAVPTMFWAQEMTASQDEKWFSGWATDAEVCDAFRVVFTGTTLSFSSGTFETIYFT